MKKTKFTESQIVAAIKKQESGIATKEICRELGISDATFYDWKAKYEDIYRPCMKKANGYFVISLDFELMWGVRDKVIKKTYGKNILGVQTVIPRLLETFNQHNIHATFATVGFLFYKNKKEMLDEFPSLLPNYHKHCLSPYGSYMETEVGSDYITDPYHFAPNLVQMIQDTSNHEIGTHTFSHYYCLEHGQNQASFKEDLCAAISVAKPKGINITSIVFPRNQVNENYLKTCHEMGIIAVRTNEKSWLYNARKSDNENKLRRCIRLADAYINLSGHHCYPVPARIKSIPIQIPSSRFLRPYNPRFNFFESLRLNRIKKSMTYAAKHNKVYHLWWHPHNFGINQDQNFAFLEKILKHYDYLNKCYGFSSITMSDLARKA